MQNYYQFHYDFSGIQLLHHNFIFIQLESFHALKTDLFVSQVKFTLHNFQELQVFCNRIMKNIWSCFIMHRIFFRGFKSLESIEIVSCEDLYALGYDIYKSWRKQILLLRVSGRVNQFPLISVNGWFEIFNLFKMFLCIFTFLLYH